MVNRGQEDKFRVDSTLVGLETWSHTDAARNGSILVNLRLHVPSAIETEVAGNIVALIVGYCPAAVNAALTLRWGRPCAVSADINWLTLVGIKILCLIDHACGVGDTCVVSVVVNT